MKTSIFELFKIGIGPSSSHTVGPMRAACEFVTALAKDGVLERVTALRAELYGSLALTGKGHATDHAVLLGLSGEAPSTVDPSQIAPKLETIRKSGTLKVLGRHPVAFQEARDLLFHKDMVLPGHPNAMRFTAADVAGNVVRSQVYSRLAAASFSAKARRLPRKTARPCHIRLAAERNCWRTAFPSGR